MMKLVIFDDSSTNNISKNQNGIVMISVNDVLGPT